MPAPRTRLAGLPVLAALLAGTAATAGSAPAAADPAPAVRAPVVRGAILAHWNDLGGRAGFLGAPLSSEAPTRPRVGAFSTFSGGSIFWSPRSGAYETHGAVRETWFAQRAENGRLGFPVSDEQRTPGGTGVVGRFERGSVYWSARTGAHVVQGDVLRAYRHAGEDGTLGLPTSDEVPLREVNGAVSFFERGAVYWSRDGGTGIVRGAIRAAWTQSGAERSLLGLPQQDEERLPGGDVVQVFQGGALGFGAAHGVYVAEAFGDVVGLDPLAHRLLLDGLPSVPVRYRDTDDFYSVDARTVILKPTRISADQFAALSRDGVVLVQEDPGGTSAFTVLVGASGPTEVTPAPRAAARAH